MRRRTLLIAAVALGLASSAAAQAPGGGMGGGGHGRGGHGQKPDGSSSSDARRSSGPSKPETPVNEMDMFGVIQAVDPQAQRITIAYEANDALNMPKGEAPFEVAKTDLLKGATVGETVRFRIDSHQISLLTPYQPPAP